MLTPRQVKRIKRALTLRLPSADYGFGEGPRSFAAYKDDGIVLSVPRNWADARSYLRHSAFEDRRAHGTPINLTFNTTFRPGQHQFVEDIVSGIRRNGLGAIGQAGCGFGKTACATAVMAELDTTTLVVVHKEKLMQQFSDACQQFLGVKPGIIQGNRCEYKGFPISIGMIQSLYQRDHGPDFYNYFGLLVCDETHRMAAPTFNEAICKINSRYRLGLTATPRRGDNLEDVFFWHIGEIESVGRGQFLDCSVYQIDWNPQLKRGQWMFRGRPHLGRMITALAKDSDRTGMLCRLIAKATRAGRNSLVLSDRCAHVDDICNRLQLGFKAAGESYTVGVFRAGGTKKVKAERARAVDCDVTIGTWAMAMEGLDIPAKDTVFFATPKADVEQACGRIRRIYGSKKPPMIVDICDDLGFLHRFARKRENYYVTSGLDKGVWVIRYVKRVAA